MGTDETGFGGLGPRNDNNLAVDLKSVAAGKGASMVGVHDSGGLFDSNDVESALQEEAFKRFVDSQNLTELSNKLDASLPQPDDFWCACIDYDNLVLSGNDSTAAIGVARAGQQTRNVQLAVGDSVNSSGTWTISGASFSENNIGGKIVLNAPAVNAGTYQVLTYVSPTQVTTSGTLTNESFTSANSAVVVGGPRATRDAALAAAKQTPFKTLERLGQLLPRFGNNANFFALGKPRAGAAVYKKMDGQTDEVFTWCNGAAGWRMFHFRPTNDFTNSAEDKIVCGFQTVAGTNAAGYNTLNGTTVSSLICQQVGGASAGFPAENFSGVGVGSFTGKRIRFLNSTATTALKNKTSNIWKNTSTNLTAGKDFPALSASLSDVFVIDEPAFKVYDSSHRLGINYRTSIVGLVNSVTDDLHPCVIYNPASDAAYYAGVEAQPGTHWGFIKGTSSVNMTETYGDEMAGYPSYVIGSSPSPFQGIGVGYRARLDNDQVDFLLIRCSTDISDTQRIWKGTRFFQIGLGCLFKAGINWVGTNQGVSRFPAGSGVDAGSIGLAAATSCFGSDGLTTYRRLRVPQPQSGAGAIGVIGGGVRISGVDVSNSNASAVALGGVGSNVTIDDVVSSDGNNTGVFIDTVASGSNAPAFDSFALVGTFAPNTFSASLGDIRLSDGTIATAAGLSTAPYTDTRGNRFVGSAGVKPATAVPNGSQAQSLGATGPVGASPTPTRYVKIPDGAGGFFTVPSFT